MPRKMTSKSTILLVLGLLAVAAGTLYGLTMMKPGASASASSIPTVKVIQGPFEKTVSSIGELRASKSAIIASPYDGKVVRLVEEGTAVKAGDPVIWLSTDDYTDKLKEVEPQLLLAQKDLEAAHEEYHLQELQNDYDLRAEQARVELAEQKEKDSQQKFDTEKILVERRISPRSNLDQAQLSLLQAGVELRSARINLQKTRENLSSNLRVKQNKIDKAQLEVDRINKNIEDLKKKIDEATMRAPANGEVSYFKLWKNGTAAKVAEGDQIWPRLNLLEIPDRSQMLAIVPVNELDIAAVEQGQRAQITLDAAPGRIFPGIVDRKSIVPIDNSAASRRGGPAPTSQGPREFEVQVRLEEQDSSFFQGMTATVVIQVSQLPQALQVPIESLTLRGQEVGVYRTSGIGPEFVPLEVKMTNGRHAAVDGPLKPEDKVYLRNPKVELQEARALGYEALRIIRDKQDKAMQALEAQRRSTQQPSEAAGPRRRQGPPAGGGA